MNIPSISLDALLSDRQLQGADIEAMELLAEAEIILGQDTMTRKVFLIEGKTTLKNVMQNIDSHPVNVVLVELNRESDDIQQLRELIDIAKCR